MNNFKIKFIAGLLAGTSAFATSQASLNPQQGAIRTQNEELTLERVLTQANIDITTEEGKWNAMGYCMLGRYMANSYKRPHRRGTTDFLIEKKASYINDWQQISGEHKEYDQLANDQYWWRHAKTGMQNILIIREDQKQTFDERMAEHVNKYFSILRDCDYTFKSVQEFLDVSIADSRCEDALGSKADRIARPILSLYSLSPRNMISLSLPLPQKRLSFIEATLQNIGTTIIDEKDLEKMKVSTRAIKNGYINKISSTDIRDKVINLITICDKFSKGERNCNPKEKKAIKTTRKNLQQLLDTLIKTFGQ